jgi:hypothetical protein
MGFGVAGPFMDFVNDLSSGNVRNIPSDEYAADNEAAQISQDLNDAPMPDEPSAVPVFEDTIGGLAIAYMPPGMTSSPASLTEFIGRVKAVGANAVLIDVKDRNGNVLYKSNLPEVLDAGAVSDNAFEAGAVVAELLRAGLLPIARMYTFEDPIAANFYRDRAVMYINDPKWLWLDNSPENGGRPWLNPVSSDAVKYVSSIARECASLGFAHIFADSVQFPRGYGQNLAYYGEDEFVRRAVLSRFVRELEGTLYSDGVGFAVMGSTAAFTNEYPDQYGGSLSQIEADNFVPVILPSELPQTIIFSDDTTFSDTGTRPYEVTLRILEYIKQTAPNTSLIPFIQCYGAYPTGTFQSQRRAVTELGFNSYVMFDPAGRYELEIRS